MIIKIPASTFCKNIVKLHYPILGDAWYRFLSQCQYTIGSESGTSLLDRDGSIKQKVIDYQSFHPDAGFKEVEAACFQGMDGNCRLYALSPRHLEACATRTCQVLVEGEYNGILKPGVHYIELKRDFSNLDAVIDAIRRDALRHGIVEKAYKDIVESGHFTYKRFIPFIIERTLGTMPPADSRRTRQQLVYYWMECVEVLEWSARKLYSKTFAPLVKKFRPLTRRIKTKAWNALKQAS